MDDLEQLKREVRRYDRRAVTQQSGPEWLVVGATGAIAGSMNSEIGAWRCALEHLQATHKPEAPDAREPYAL